MSCPTEKSEGRCYEPGCRAKHKGGRFTSVAECCLCSDYFPCALRAHPLLSGPGSRWGTDLRDEATMAALCNSTADVLSLMHKAELENPGGPDSVLSSLCVLHLRKLLKDLWRPTKRWSDNASAIAGGARNLAEQLVRDLLKTPEVLQSTTKPKDKQAGPGILADDPGTTGMAAHGSLPATHGNPPVHGDSCPKEKSDLKLPKMSFAKMCDCIDAWVQAQLQLKQRPPTYTRLCLMVWTIASEGCGLHGRVSWEPHFWDLGNNLVFICNAIVLACDNYRRCCQLPRGDKSSFHGQACRQATSPSEQECAFLCKLKESLEVEERGDVELQKNVSEKLKRLEQDKQSALNTRDVDVLHSSCSSIALYVYQSISFNRAQGSNALVQRLHDVIEACLVYSSKFVERHRLFHVVIFIKDQASYYKRLLNQISELARLVAERAVGLGEEDQEDLRKIACKLDERKTGTTEVEHLYERLMGYRPHVFNAALELRSRHSEHAELSKMMLVEVMHAGVGIGKEHASKEVDYALALLRAYEAGGNHVHIFHPDIKAMWYRSPLYQEDTSELEPVEWRMFLLAFPNSLPVATSKIEMICGWLDVGKHLFQAGMHARSVNRKRTAAFEEHLRLTLDDLNGTFYDDTAAVEDLLKNCMDRAARDHVPDPPTPPAYDHVPHNKRKPESALDRHDASLAQSALHAMKSQPLLLSGAPGAGKSTLGARIMDQSGAASCVKVDLVAASGSARGLILTLCNALGLEEEGYEDEQDSLVELHQGFETSTDRAQEAFVSLLTDIADDLADERQSAGSPALVLFLDTCEVPMQAGGAVRDAFVSVLSKIVELQIPGVQLLLASHPGPADELQALLPSLHKLDLEALEEDAAVELVKCVLTRTGTALPEEEALQLARACGGNPLKICVSAPALVADELDGRVLLGLAASTDAYGLLLHLLPSTEMRDQLLGLSMFSGPFSTLQAEQLLGCGALSMEQSLKWLHSRGLVVQLSPPVWAIHASVRSAVRAVDPEEALHAHTRFACHVISQFVECARSGGSRWVARVRSWCTKHQADVSSALSVASTSRQACSAIVQHLLRPLPAPTPSSSPAFSSSAAPSLSPAVAQTSSSSSPPSSSPTAAAAAAAPVPFLPHTAPPQQSASASSPSPPSPSPPASLPPSSSSPPPATPTPAPSTPTEGTPELLLERLLGMLPALTVGDLPDLLFPALQLLYDAVAASYSALPRSQPIKTASLKLRDLLSKEPTITLCSDQEGIASLKLSSCPAQADLLSDQDAPRTAFEEQDALLFELFVAVSQLHGQLLLKRGQAEGAEVLRRACEVVERRGALAERPETPLLYLQELQKQGKDAAQAAQQLRHSLLSVQGQMEETAALILHKLNFRMGTSDATLGHLQVCTDRAREVARACTDPWQAPKAVIRLIMWLASHVRCLQLRGELGGAAAVAQEAQELCAKWLGGDALNTRQLGLLRVLLLLQQQERAQKQRRVGAAPGCDVEGLRREGWAASTAELQSTHNQLRPWATDPLMRAAFELLLHLCCTSPAPPAHAGSAAPPSQAATSAEAMHACQGWLTQGLKLQGPSSMAVLQRTTFVSGKLRAAKAHTEALALVRSVACAYLANGLPKASSAYARLLHEQLLCCPSFAHPDVRPLLEELDLVIAQLGAAAGSQTDGRGGAAKSSADGSGAAKSGAGCTSTAKACAEASCFRWLATARLHIAGKEWDGAVTAYQNVLPILPDAMGDAKASEVLAALATVYVRKGCAMEALATMQKVIAGFEGISDEDALTRVKKLASLLPDVGFEDDFGDVRAHKREVCRQLAAHRHRLMDSTASPYVKKTKATLVQETMDEAHLLLMELSCFTSMGDPETCPLLERMDGIASEFEGTKQGMQVRHKRHAIAARIHEARSEWDAAADANCELLLTGPTVLGGTKMNPVFISLARASFRRGFYDNALSSLSSALEDGADAILGGWQHLTQADISAINSLLDLISLHQDLPDNSRKEKKQCYAQLGMAKWGLRTRMSQRESTDPTMEDPHNNAFALLEDLACCATASSPTTVDILSKLDAAISECGSSSARAERAQCERWLQLACMHAQQEEWEDAGAAYAQALPQLHLLPAERQADGLLGLCSVRAWMQDTKGQLDALGRTAEVLQSVQDTGWALDRLHEAIEFYLPRFSWRDVKEQPEVLAAKNVLCKQLAEAKGTLQSSIPARPEPLTEQGKQEQRRLRQKELLEDAHLLLERLSCCDSHSDPDAAEALDILPSMAPDLGPHGQNISFKCWQYRADAHAANGEWAAAGSVYVSALECAGDVEQDSKEVAECIEGRCRAQACTGNFVGALRTLEAAQDNCHFRPGRTKPLLTHILAQITRSAHEDPRHQSPTEEQQNERLASSAR